MSTFIPSYCYRTAMIDVLNAAQSEEGGFITPAEIQRILAKHGLPTQPSALVALAVVPPVAAPGEASADVRYATTKQKEEIIRLLNNPVITRAEKTKMLLNINKMNQERAQLSIDKLRLAIKEREAEQRIAA